MHAFKGPDRRKRWVWAAAGWLAAAAGGEAVSPAGGGASAAAALVPLAVAELARGNNAFAFDLYSQLGNDSGNLFFSPISVRLALAMTYAGAQGETARQMEQALRFTLKDAPLHGAFEATIKQILPEDSAGGQLTIANSLWGQKGYRFLDPFLVVTRTCYGGGFHEADFRGGAEGSRQAINLWVEDHTRQKIKDFKEALAKGIEAKNS